MTRTKQDFLEMFVSGAFHAVQKKDDPNREDIAIGREDGRAAEIHNFPYRANQMPAYIFDEFVRDGILKDDGTDGRGGTVFRAIGFGLKRSRRAA